MPEISVGIGRFLTMIEFLSQVSVVINCAIAYFTSNTYEKFFVTDDSSTWHVGAVGFLILVVTVEHVIFFLKTIIEMDTN